MKIALLGARGMFGRDAAPLWRNAGWEVAEADLPEVDVTDRSSLGSFLDALGPSAVVNAAAFTDVDGAESRREEAFRVNAEGAGVVAEACAARGLFLLHLSTDYVFPGDRPEGYLPGDPPGPAVNAYGESKLAGEEAVRAVLPPDRFLICRTQWLYGRHGRNFVETILALARNRERLKVVDDQWGVPTWTHSLARQVGGLLRRGIRGYAHAVGGGGPVTWYAFAREIVRLSGLACVVEPCATENFPRPARRPAHAWLRPDPSAPPAEPWTSDLARYLGAEDRPFPSS